MRVAFVHPDLGIGGAEQLVVNAACGLVRRGHDVTIYTAHHDPSHCFAETTGDGLLAGRVRVHGAWLPRTVLFGRGYALCAVLRMLYCALVVLVLAANANVIFADQVSANVPLLRLRGTPVVFYCHFPDKLLCVERAGLLKRLYRLPLDWLEERTTGAADLVLVNSRFTAGVFREAFPSLAATELDVLYPSIDMSKFVPPAADKRGWKVSPTPMFASVNRFERKKNIGLCIKALALMPGDRARLVVAGGYDTAVEENVEHLKELKELAEAEGVSDRVDFRPNVSDEGRAELLNDARAIIYTPDREHFGIVPLEAMYAGNPVVAVASGGPLETVKDGETGFLCEPEPEHFAQRMRELEADPALARRLGEAGHVHVAESFSAETFEERLETLCKSVLS